MAQTSPPQSDFPNMPDKEADLNQVWAYLRCGMDHVMVQADLPRKIYNDIYSAVYNYCTSELHGGRRSKRPVGSDLYVKLIEYFVQHLQPLMERSENLQDVDLLRYYIFELDQYITSANYLNRLFIYFNRHWVNRQRDEGRKDVYQVHTLAHVQWKSHFFAHIQKDSAKLTNAVLCLITQQRNGKFIDEESLVKRVVDSFISLGLDNSDPSKECLDVYREQFEGPFLQTTENYYEAESESFLSENSVSDYLKKAEERLRDEDALVDRCLHVTTRKDLISKCEHVLIRVHCELLWESFQSLLESDKDEDLQRMYALLSRIPEGLEPLRYRFEGHVKQAGLSSISKLVGEGGESGDVDPKAYVDVLLEVYRKNSDMVQRNFKGDAGFAAGLDKACREFVNRNAATGTSSTKSPELIAKYADMLLRENDRMVVGDDLKRAVDRLIILFEYLEGKDTFRALCTIKLPESLICGGPVPDET